MAIKVASSGSSEQISPTLSEINVVPLVDVVLVLLLIFMLTAPMMYRGIDVNLPKTGKSSNAAEMEKKVILTLTKSKQIFVNEKSATMTSLEGDLSLLFKDRKDKTLYLKADREIPYGSVVEIMNEVHAAGVEKIGMVTEPSGYDKKLLPPIDKS